MKLQLLTVGSKLPAWAQSGCDEYTKRFPRHLSLDIRSVDVPRGGKSEEGAKLLRAITTDMWVVAMDERGQSWTSKHLAGRLAEWQQNSPRVTIVIGGADGLDSTVLKRANASWSLGAPTYPHALVRVMVIEQLYRATTILSGHPYHRE